MHMGAAEVDQQVMAVTQVITAALAVAVLKVTGSLH
jgi:hypothetical protein